MKITVTAVDRLIHDSRKEKRLQVEVLSTRNITSLDGIPLDAGTMTRARGQSHGCCKPEGYLLRRKWLDFEFYSTSCAMDDSMEKQC